MDLTASIEYPADLATTFALVTDGELAVARYTAGGHEEVELLEDLDDGDDHVWKTRGDVTVDLPGFAAKVLQPTNTIEQEHRWGPEHDGTHGGTFTVETKGAPVETKGTMRLEAMPGGGTRHTIEATLKVKVPLIGGKVERWGKDDFQQQLDHELAWNRDRLSSG
jgi:hypothetical protein